MGRKRPHSDTTECITRSDRVQNSQIHVFFEVPYSDDSRIKQMTLSSAEFMRRFLLHVLPDGFQRIRHYGFLANGNRQAKLARIRELLPPALLHPVVSAPGDTNTATLQPEGAAPTTADDQWQPTCPECGCHMEIVEELPKARRDTAHWIDTS